MALRKLKRSSEEISKAARDVKLTDRGRPAKGRPSLQSRASDRDLAEAPFPELVTEPSDRLTRKIRQIDDIDLLREAFSFELSRRSRKSVLGTIEGRVRALGGPPLILDLDPPFPGYRSMEPAEIMARLGPDNARAVEGFELANENRPEIISLAGSLKRDHSGPEPFPGYRGLSTTPAARKKVRDALRKESESTLEKTLLFEQQTKRRSVMIRAIRRELRDRG